jgi:hypothetical protein
LHFSGDKAYASVETQVYLNTTDYRTPGTQGREDCAQYFLDEFDDIDPSLPSIIHNFTVLSIDCQNILFKMNDHLDNIVILAAHYDSRKQATKDPNTSLRDDPVPGANDGGSGCGVLIELARVFNDSKTQLDCQLWFLFFDAEDQGYDVGPGISGWGWCEGSTRFANNLNDYHDVGEYFDCLVLLDMVGGINLKFINEQHSTSSLLAEIFEIGRQLGYTQAFPSAPISATITDDHVAFKEKMPIADLIINFWNDPSWPYHHTTQDDLDHILNSSLEITGRTIEQFIYNNYLDIPENNYRGNYPWRQDINFIDTEILIVLILFGSVVGILGLGYFIFKKYRITK